MSEGPILFLTHCICHVRSHKHLFSLRQCLCGRTGQSTQRNAFGELSRRLVGEENDWVGLSAPEGLTAPHCAWA